MSKDEKKTLTDAEIAERGGMGYHPSDDEEEEEDPTDPEEGDESETDEDTEDDTEEESDEGQADDDEESEADDEESEDKEEDAEEDDDDESEEDESDESEDDPEEGDEDEDDDEPEDEGDDRRGKRTVPYGKFKAERGKVKALGKEIKEVRGMLEKLLGGKGTKKEKAAAEEDMEDFDAAAEALGRELGQDSKGIAKVLKVAVDLAAKRLGGKVPKDLQEKLQLLDKLQKKEGEDRAAKHFQKEWSTLQPILKKRFPNASESMLAEARKVMDEIAHGKTGGKVIKLKGGKERFIPYDLDYLLYKNESKFSTILSAQKGGKSGEGGKQIGTGGDDDTDEGDSLVPIEDVTPEIMRKREMKKRGATRDDDDPNFQIHDPIEA